jgi:hypothetical protein
MDLGDELIGFACDNRATSRPLSRFGIFPVTKWAREGEGGVGEVRIRSAWLWQAGESEEKSAHGLQFQDAREDQDSAKTVPKFRVAKVAKDTVLGVKVV